MLGLGWLTIRQAQEALAHGRLEEAHRLLGRPEVQGHKGASSLFQQIAQAYVQRGEQQLAHDNLAGAWHDLRLAEQLGGPNPAVARLRQELTKRGMEEARKLLDAGEASRALEALAPLRDGFGGPAAVQFLEEVAKGWTLARDLARRGEFALALETVERIRLLLPRPSTPLERFRHDLKLRRPEFAALLIQLHEVIDQQRWRDVAALAEQALALAPFSGEARKARARAWKILEPAPNVKPSAVAEALPSRRFLLWIDGAGGYLVCLGSRITLGQAAPDAYVDIPLFADVSRTHAALTRDAEGYLLEAVRAVEVNGQAVEKALLQPGDRITLGTCCQFQFRQPVPVSATARLDLVSGHRLPLTVDGVILMADTLVLGSGSQAHVTIPDLEQPVMLFRQKGSLGVRYGGNLVVDGQACRERGVLGPASQVRGDDFAFAVETLGAKIGPG
jgi:tetratricopeptide (TPR) repeat protein